MSNKEKFRTTIGGQALMEGIMMRGPKKTAIVVRGPERIEVQEKPNANLKDRYPVLGVPFIRGVINFTESMVFGMKALMWSAQFTELEDEHEKSGETDEDGKGGGKKVQDMVIWSAVVLGLVIAIGLFTVLPTFLGSLFGSYIGSGIWRNLAETALRLVILFSYMILVSRMKEIQRVFMYHGAEHKTIACYEAGEELTVENVRRFTRKHPRCGTSFLLTVMITSLIVFFLANILLSGLNWSNTFLRIGFRLLLLPIVVGISYEANRWMGRSESLLSRLLRAPGLWMQNLTTREPEDGMIEIGIDAMKRVIPESEGEDLWGTG
jgi:uncharacterized protein YqhQ